MDPGSVVAGLPTAAEFAQFCRTLDDPAEDQLLVERDGRVVGHASVRWLGHARLGRDRVRRLVRRHGTARSAVFGANAMEGEQADRAHTRVKGDLAAENPAAASVTFRA
ncbi:hypothetical protein [Nonomuraea sp. KM90]|uniref:hypothetical protein n=1 Tax=Nonomuraea sp. KM90 TaxID=3457428 RepID=UPI003FCE8289